MRALRVLITNLSLSARSGTEMHARDLAIELLRRGHAPTVYSPLPGAVADELLACGVRVVADLDGERGAPDVIHGHHMIETMTAVLRHPGVPAIFVCHDRTSWHDQPPRHPRLRAYVAVDENCRERFAEVGIGADRVRVIPNAVDLARFRPRSPLPDRPRRALLFSHYAAEFTHLPVVREACVRAGVELDVRGNASGRPCERPEDLLGGYDLVFAKARCALEAMAVGCAVVLCDHLGTGPLVGPGEWESLRALNFGRRACDGPLAVDSLLAEVARYDAAGAAEVCRLTRGLAGIETAADAFQAAYEDVIREQATSPTSSPDGEVRAAVTFLGNTFTRRLTQQIAAAESEQWKSSALVAHRGWAELQGKYYEARQECAAAWKMVEEAHRRCLELRRACDRMALANPHSPGFHRWTARVSRLWSRIRRTFSRSSGC